MTKDESSAGAGRAILATAWAQQVRAAEQDEDTAGWEQSKDRSAKKDGRPDPTDGKTPV